MKLPTKQQLFKQEQLNSASSGERIMMSDLTIVKHDVNFMSNMPHIQLRNSGNSLNNIKKKIFHINALSPYLC